MNEIAIVQQLVVAAAIIVVAMVVLGWFEARRLATRRSRWERGRPHVLRRGGGSAPQLLPSTGWQLTVWVAAGLALVVLTSAA